MGQDKALLSIKGLRALDHLRQTLLQTSLKAVVVSRNEPHKGYLEDLIPQKGPLSGMHAAAVKFPKNNLLIVPIDLPLMNHQTLERLIEEGTSHQGIVRYQKEPMPLYAHNTAAFRQALSKTLLESNCFSVNVFCQQFPLSEVKLDNPLSLFNANTPEQWQFAKKHFYVNPSTDESNKNHESFKHRV